MQLSQARQKEIKAVLTRHGRRKSNRIVVEGIRAIETMLAAGVSPDYVVVSREHLTHAGERFFSSLDFGAAPVYDCPAKDFDEISDTVRSQGILAVVQWHGWADRLEKIVGAARFILYLDGVSDPGNVGTIIRTAAAFNVDLVALSPDAAEIGNPKVVRASAGLIFSLPIEKVADSEAFFSLLQSNSIEALGAVADAPTDIEDIESFSKVCLAIGSEARGLSDEVRSRCRKLVAVRTSARVESLNAAAAAAIAINTVARKLRVL